jgi:integrase
LNLTKHAIAALPTPKAGKRVGYHDTRVPGLGVVVQDTGNRMFFWFRKVRGRRTWKTLGNFPDLTIEQARDKAQEINASLAKWKATEHSGPSPFERKGEPTLAAAVEDYVTKRLRSHAKNPDRAEAGVRWSAKKYLAPLLTRRLGTIRKDDVRKLHTDIGEKHGRVTANRVATLLRTIFNWAIDNDLWHGENPARRITLFAEASRERFLQPDELARLFKALSNEPNKDLRDFVVLSLFTGARRGDVFSMRWSDITFETTSWRIPDPKVRVPYIVPLMPEAVEILNGRRNDSIWVFPSRGKTGHLTGVKRSWTGLLTRAKIIGLHIHDLRRTLGSWQAAAGVSLPIIGASLGHQSQGATAIYARLNIDPVRQAVTAATQAMLAAKENPKLLKVPKRG